MLMYYATTISLIVGAFFVCDNFMRKRNRLLIELLCSRANKYSAANALTRATS